MSIILVIIITILLAASCGVLYFNYQASIVPTSPTFLWFILFCFANLCTSLFLFSTTRKPVTSTMKGAIEKKRKAKINGTTYFYYVVENCLCRAPITINEYQIMYEVGDEVELEVYFNKNGVGQITSITSI